MSFVTALRKTVLLGVALIVFGLTSFEVRADQIFVVNSTIVGTGAVNAQATFHQSAGNLLQITLQNMQSTSNVGQGISGIQFQICDAQGNVLNLTGSITAQNNPMINVDGSGNVTPMGTLATGWGLASSGPSFNLTALGFTGNGTNPPDELILGPLSGPNGSIAGNGPHNPFINQTGVFSVTLSGNLPAGFQICNVVLLFGTGPNSVPATTAAVPEPTTMLLFGAGLVGLASRIRKRRRGTGQD